MATSKRKFVLCNGRCVLPKTLGEYPHAHIIGELVHVEDEGRKVPALARYAVSVDVTCPPDEMPIVDCYLIGDAREVKCRRDGCRHSIRWETSQAAILILMAKTGTLREYQKDV